MSENELFKQMIGLVRNVNKCYSVCKFIIFANLTESRLAFYNNNFRSHTTKGKNPCIRGICYISVYLYVLVLCVTMHFQKSHASLSRKLSEEASELNRLVRLTSSELSSASEATPDHTSHFSFSVPRGPHHETSPSTLHRPPFLCKSH